MSRLTLILSVYAVMSAVTLIAYAWDKHIACRGRRQRVAERTLHLFALLGGWPGSLVGQQLFRHKRRKFSFVATTWLIVAAHVAAWVWTRRH